MTAVLPSQKPLVPINTLPNELLLDIFEYTLPSVTNRLAKWDPLSLSHASYGDEERAYFVQLSKLSSVNRAWRTLLANTPSFWSLFTIHVPEMPLEQTSARSGDLPMQLACTIPTSYKQAQTDEELPITPERRVDGKTGKPLEGEELAHVFSNREITDDRINFFMSATSGQTHRWKDAVLQLPIQTFDTVVRQLETPAPLLERLELTFFVASQPLHARVPRPISLFAGEAPNLRHVKLFSVTTEWDSPVYHGLESLELVDIGERAPTAHQILNIMENSPLLATLGIQDALSSDTGVDEDQKTVAAEKLQHVQLKSIDASTARDILANIQGLPSCSSLRVQCYWDGKFPTTEFFDSCFGHLQADLKRLFSSSSNLPSSPILIQCTTIIRLTSPTKAFDFEAHLAPELKTPFIRWVRSLLRASGSTTPIVLRLSGMEMAADEDFWGLVTDLNVLAVHCCGDTNMEESQPAHQRLAEFLTTPRTDGSVTWPSLRRLEFHYPQAVSTDLLHQLRARQRQLCETTSGKLQIIKTSRKNESEEMIKSLGSDYFDFVEKSMALPTL